MQQIFADDAVDIQCELTADSAMLLALMLARRCGGTLSSPAMPLAGKTLGLIGFDEVARAVARRASQGFGMHVLVQGASCEERALAKRLGVMISPSLDHLLDESGFVSLHGRPADSATFINAQRLNQMKPDALLINASHGALMDEQALIHALWFETIGGAGIAVPPETLDRVGDFQACEHAIVLPNATDVPSPFSPAHAAHMPNNVIPFSDHHQRV